jgi:energy-coupling factor transporter ATP-binding protein EcfA2
VAARGVAAAPTVIPWEAFSQVFAGAHKQGEHVAIVGPTGSGKSVLELELAKIIGARTTRQGKPASVTVLATKPRDDTVAGLGWPVLKSWPPSYGQEHNIVWPKARTPSTAARDQRKVFGPLLDAIYHEGGQAVVIDEAAYFERPLPKGLGLAPTLEQYWSSARSLKLTLVAATQRPRLVSRSMWSEPSWVFVFRPEDRDDLKRVAELSGRRDEVLELTELLGGFEFLAVRRQRAGQRELYVSRVEPPARRSPRSRDKGRRRPSRSDTV